MITRPLRRVVSAGIALIARTLRLTAKATLALVAGVAMLLAALGIAWHLWARYADVGKPPPRPIALASHQFEVPVAYLSNWGDKGIRGRVQGFSLAVLYPQFKPITEDFEKSKYGLPYGPGNRHVNIAVFDRRSPISNAIPNKFIPFIKAQQGKVRPWGRVYPMGEQYRKFHGYKVPYGYYDTHEIIVVGESPESGVVMECGTLEWAPFPSCVTAIELADDLVVELEWHRDLIPHALEIRACGLALVKQFLVSKQGVDNETNAGRCHAFESRRGRG
jgi:hypothetical protein